MEELIQDTKGYTTLASLFCHLYGQIASQHSKRKKIPIEHIEMEQGFSIFGQIVEISMNAIGKEGLILQEYLAELEKLHNELKELKIFYPYLKDLAVKL